MDNNPQLARITDNLKRLKLHKTSQRLESLLQEAGLNDVSYTDFLDQLLTEEISQKHEKQITMHTTMARLPYIKTLEAFDFSFQPSIDTRKVKELAACTFIERAKNVIFLGPPGTEKTHLSVSLGLKAIQRSYRILFTSAVTLIVALTKAYAENRLEEKLKFYCIPKLLIIDEIGYVPVDQHGAHLLFQLISRRYERGSIVLPATGVLDSGEKYLVTILLLLPSWIGSYITALSLTSRVNHTG